MKEETKEAIVLSLAVVGIVAIGTIVFAIANTSSKISQVENNAVSTSPVNSYSAWGMNPDASSSNNSASNSGSADDNTVVYSAKNGASNEDPLKEQENLTSNETNCNQMMQNIAASNGVNASSTSKEYYTVTNHFNTRLQKCFVELDQFVVLANGSVVGWNTIWDAVENNVVASCNTGVDGYGICNLGYDWAAQENEYMKG
jgi:hypothetical protein